MSVITEWAL